jgi:thiol-disulfide isomerase/thioredoxin
MHDISKSWPFISVFALLVVALFVFLVRESDSSSKNYSMSPEASAFSKDFMSFEILEPRVRLPDVKVMNPEGGFIRLVDLVKVTDYTVLNLWATWCPPCIAEIPSLIQLQNLRPNIKVIGVSFDIQREPEQLGMFFNKHDITDFNWYYDQSMEMRRFIPTKGLPTTFIINKDKEIIYKMEGHADWSSEKALSFIDSLLVSK